MLMAGRRSPPFIFAMAPPAPYRDAAAAGFKHMMTPCCFVGKGFVDVARAASLRRHVSRWPFRARSAFAGLFLISPCWCRPVKHRTGTLQMPLDASILAVYAYHWPTMALKRRGCEISRHYFVGLFIRLHISLLRLYKPPRSRDAGRCRLRSAFICASICATSRHRPRAPYRRRGRRRDSTSRSPAMSIGAGDEVEAFALASREA